MPRAIYAEGTGRRLPTIAGRHRRRPATVPDKLSIRTLLGAARGAAVRFHCLRLGTPAQLDRLLKEAVGAQDLAARECECHRQRLAAGEPAVLWSQVEGPGMGFTVARVGLRETPGTKDGTPADLLACVHEHIEEVAVGARVCPGHRCDPV